MAHLRKICVGNVPPEMPSDRLLAVFSSYGEIEEGPLGLDNLTGGDALFVYKTAEAAQAAIKEPTKSIDGHQLTCKLADVDDAPHPHSGSMLGFSGNMGIPGRQGGGN